MLFLCIATLDQTSDQLFAQGFRGKTCCEDNDFAPLVIVCVCYQSSNISHIERSLGRKELLKGAMGEINLSCNRLSNDSCAFYQQATYGSARDIPREIRHMDKLL